MEWDPSGLEPAISSQELSNTLYGSFPFLRSRLRLALRASFVRLMLCLVGPFWTSPRRERKQRSNHSFSDPVFSFGSLLVAIQVASAQLPPRIIATTLLRNDVVRFTVGLFIFTLLFALSAQNRIESAVPQLVIFVAAPCSATYIEC